MIGPWVVWELIQTKLKPDRFAGFEKAVHGLSGADAYQATMKWLHGSLTQSGVNEVIRKAVLQARVNTAGTVFQGDGNPADWYLPAGTRGLAALVAGDAARFTGPILTTNFDPLISLSLVDIGLRRRVRVIDADGALPIGAEADPGEIDVVHLHGYWQGANTLHTPAQLTSPRPKLNASLRRLLQQRTLVVVAYSGWDDVFTRALADVLQDAEAQVTVLWCFRETDAAVIESKYASLFNKVQGALTSGVLHLYGGVDCHAVFSEMANSHGAASGGANVAVSQANRLPGWQQIDAAFLGALPQSKPMEMVRYFDGAVPTWRTIVSNSIPRRAAFNKLGIFSAIHKNEQCSFQLIRAAGGEGKSTLLMQAAVKAAQGGAWNVLYRPSSQLGLSPDVLTKLDSGKRYLLIIDDAENVLESVYESLGGLHQQNLTNVDFLLAARDVDWRSANGNAKPWSQLCKQYPDIVLRGVEDEEDARAFVDAWSEYGEQGLRALSSLKDRDAMVAAFMSSVKSASDHARKEGSLLGGLLDVRFSPQSLRDHVRDCMTRLGTQTLRNSPYNLLDALIYVAACHAVGINGINGDVLADLLHVPRAWINSWVVSVLGEEAVGAMSGGKVFIRHKKVAEVILVEAELSLFFDLAEVWVNLTKQTAITGKTIKHEATFGETMHAAPRLQRLLPKAISEERRKEIALAAAQAAVSVHEDRLDQIVDLGRTYRAADDFENAAKVFRDGLVGVRTKTDYVDNARGYWYEWGICEGNRGSDPAFAATNVWLGAIAISDDLNPAVLSVGDIAMSLSGLGVAFKRLANKDPNGTFELARRAAAYIGLKKVNRRRTQGYLEIHDAECDRIGTRKPADLTEAIDWLTQGVRAAAGMLTDAWLTALADPMTLRFENMRAVVTPPSK